MAPTKSQTARAMMFRKNNMNPKNKALNQKTMTPQDIARQSYEESRLQRKRHIAGKHNEGFYVGGAPIIQGKTKAGAKAEAKEAWKNRHNK